MVRLAAILLLISSSAFAQGSTPARDCSTTAGAATTADCAKPENKSPESKPPMPQTNMKETVIPKAGATQTPDTTPTTGQNK